MLECRVSIVYGARKSGSTLLLRLLDSNHVFACEAECKLKYFSRFMVDKNPERLFDFYFPLGRAYKNNQEAIKYRSYIEKKIKHIKSVDDFVYLHLCAQAIFIFDYSEPEIAFQHFNDFLIKEVGGEPSEVIPLFLAARCSKNVVLIERNPDWIISAIFRQRRSAGIKIKHKTLWYESLDSRYVNYAIKHIGVTKRITRVSYELYTRETELLMKELATFLCLNFSRTMLSPTLNGVSTEVNTSSRVSKTVFSSSGSVFLGLSQAEKAVLLASRYIFWLYFLFKTIFRSHDSRKF